MTEVIEKIDSECMTGGIENYEKEFIICNLKARLYEIDKKIKKINKQVSQLELLEEQRRDLKHSIEMFIDRM